MSDTEVSQAPSGQGAGDQGAGEGQPSGETDSGPQAPVEDEAGLGAGCDGAVLRAAPDDPAARGPWAVGARTVQIGRLTVEVFYPASGSVATPAQYDIRDALPPSEAAKISDALNPWQLCDCERELSIDDAHGPYPALVFVHGTAGWRTQSLRHAVHWASRGFIVVSAGHPGLMLRDTLAPLCGQSAQPRDLSGDIRALLAAIRGQSPGLETFADVLDDTRIGMVGHSAGGSAVGAFSDDAQVIIPLTAGPTVAAGSQLASTLLIGGTADSVVNYSSVQGGYASSAAPKRLVGIANAGHLVPSEICSTRNEDGQNLLEVAQATGVCGAMLAGFLFQCADTLLDDATGWEIVEYATTAAFEETLHCSSEATERLAAVADVYPEVSELEELLE